MTIDEKIREAVSIIDFTKVLLLSGDNILIGEWYRRTMSSDTEYKGLVNNLIKKMGKEYVEIMEAAVEDMKRCQRGDCPTCGE